MKNILLNLKKRKSYKLFLFCLLVFALKSFLDYSNIFFFLPEIIQNFFNIFILILELLLIYYLFLILIWLYKKITWKIRNKLIISHIFISAVPIILIIILIALTLTLITYQLSSFQINRYFIHKGNELYKAYSKEWNLLQKNNDPINSFYEFISKDYPIFVLLIKEKLQGISKLIISKKEYPLLASQDYFFQKIVQPYDIYYSYEITKLIKEKININDKISELANTYFAFHFQSEKFDSILLLPIRKSDILELTDLCGYSLAENYFMAKAVATSSNIIITKSPESIEAPAKRNSQFPVLLLIKNLESSKEAQTYQAIILYVDYKKTWDNIFKDKSYIGLIGRGIIKSLIIVAIILFIVEVISLLIGIKITRSITKAVDSLYGAANNIQKGNLETEVNIKSPGQLYDLGCCFNSMISSIRNLIKEKSQKEAMEKELEIARKIQEQLLPPSNFELPQIEIISKFLPAKMVSGDYYDLFNFKDKLAVIIGDVSGKGLSAGLIMANIQAIIRSYFLQKADAGNYFNLADLVKLINSHLLKYTPLNKFVSMHFSLFDINNLSLIYCTAGHPPPIVIRKDNQIIKLETKGMILGSFENAEFSISNISLLPEDLILYYTDGLIEATDNEFQEYGEERLIKFLLQNKHLSLNELIDFLLEDVNQFSCQQLSDDIALIAVRIPMSAAS